MAETNQELGQKFYARFQTATSDLSARLDAFKSGGASTDAIDKLAADVAVVRKELTDAVPFLPAYDHRQCEAKLKEIEASLDVHRSASAAKPKFSFKRKAAAKPASQSPTPPPPAPSAPAESTPVTAANATGLVLAGHSHRYLTASALSSPWTSPSDLTISDLDHCVLNLLPESASAPALTALHVRNLTDTVLILPVVTGSALLHDLQRCTIVLGCRQFRMHTSSAVDIYLSIASTPIIEHCTDVRFADYPSAAPFRAGVPPEAESKYLAVQDFSHIRATPSPNWSALPEDERVADARWPLSSPADVDAALHGLLRAR